jgi:predicted ferric reductase
MQIKTWHVVLFLTVTSCALVIAEIPRDTWLTSAALSLALGVAAVAMMGAAALLGSRWKIIESLFAGSIAFTRRTNGWGSGHWLLRPFISCSRQV